MRTQHSLAAGLAVAAFAAVASAPAARAGELAESAFNSFNGAAMCQGALPAFAGTLRARPLGIGNEGAAPAFVSCSVQSGGRGPGLGFSADEIYFIALFLQNSTFDAITVNCTLVDGVDSSASYFGYSTSVGAGAVVPLPIYASSLPYTPARQTFVQPNFSCSLPNGIAISRIEYVYYPARAVAP